MEKKFRILTDWFVSPNTPICIKVYWFTDAPAGSFKKTMEYEMKNNEKYVKIFDMEENEWITGELPIMHRRIPNRIGLRYWTYLRTEGEFHVFTKEEL